MISYVHFLSLGYVWLDR